MLCFVLCTFTGAGITNLRAKCAKLPCKLTPARHKPYRQSADIRAVAVQLDAASHRLYVLLAQASRRAVLARDGASNARVHTTLKFFVWHNASL